jgi:hypothetical protein
LRSAAQITLIIWLMSFQCHLRFSLFFSLSLSQKIAKFILDFIINALKIVWKQKLMARLFIFLKWIMLGKSSNQFSVVYIRINVILVLVKDGVHQIYTYHVYILWHQSICDATELSFKISIFSWRYKKRMYYIVSCKRRKTKKAFWDQREKY